MSSGSSRSASHNRGINASHLLNFRSQPPPKSNPKPKRNFPKKQSQKSFLAQKAEQRARRALSSAFYLHSSCNHAFVLKSDDYDRALSQQQRYVNNTHLSKERLALYHGPDQTMKWHHVSMVKSLVDTHTHTNGSDETNVCPICLSGHVAPRVTKCGHTFCFPCILRHLHNSSNNNGNSSDCKCPCCSHPLHASELKPVVFHSVCPPKIGSSMEFSKLYRIKRCFAPFLPPNPDNDNNDNDNDNDNDNEDSPNSSTIRTRSESFHAPRVNDKDALYCRVNYLDTQHQHHNSSTLMTHLESDVNSLQTYRKENQTDLVGTQFAIMAMEAVKLQMRECAAAATPPAASGSGNVASNKKQSLSSSLSIGADATSGGILFGGEECTQFYQATDGQLCFLSGFNMNCLLTEYTKDHDTTTTTTTTKTGTKKNPEQQSPSQQTPQPNEETAQHIITQSHPSAAPSQINHQLPNKIKGQIIDTEVIHLTPDMRKRFPFLSHLPLYTDVKFVELQLPKQHFSETTKLAYKSELEKRKKKRRNRLRAEQKLSNRIKKEEEDQVTMRRMGNQKVDFEDDFFRPAMIGPNHDAVVESPLSEGFGPGLGGNPTAVTASSSSSSAVASTGSACNRTVPKPPSAIYQVPKRNLWPDLKTGASTTTNGSGALGGRRKVAMGSAPSPPVWGNSPKSIPSSSTSSSSANRNISSLSKLGSGDGGKKMKGKHKVHLFSTGGGGGGGHRGGGY